MTAQLWAIMLVAFSSVLASVSPILLKKASQRKFSDINSIITNYPLFGAIILYVIGISIFVFALRGGDVSVLYPVSSLGYIWACLGSVRFLGERMNKTKWIGIMLIVIGVTLVGISSH
ncbi:EamA family transporter [Candidatus Woesearchaeota archaeon]|nr:EamA family transporter [Candidatus Woesearchaeota archaeon]